MHIQISKNPRGQCYYHLVESYREGGKVKKRMLMSLGKAGEDKLDKLAKAISRHRELLTVTQMAEELSVDKTFILGPLLILEKLFEQLGINEAIEEIKSSHKKLTFDLRKIIFTIVASRFILPSSKLKVFEHWQKSFYPEMLEGDLQLHHLYRAMDLLSIHKEKIEQSLYWHGRDLLNMEVDVVLYDLTTLRFESVRTDLGELRQFGYSKEMRTDCTQVVFGLLVNRDGIPLGFEVYPGNTFEGHTLTDIVDKMRKKFNVRRFIFVADRGLFSRVNIKKLVQDKGEFIVGMKMGKLKKETQDDFYNMDNFKWVMEDKLAVYDTKHEGHRCIVTWSEQRAKREKAIRDKLLDKIKRKLLSKKVKASSFVSNKGYKKYICIPEGSRPTLNEELIREEEKKDGFFGVLTNVKDIDAGKIIMEYKQLWKIEDAFGEFKGTLKARPVFHWTDHRIIGHLTMCFLAYLCEAHLSKCLREKKLMLKSPSIGMGNVGPRPLTVVEAMRELKEVRAIPVKVRSQTVWVRTDITGNATSLFRAAGVGIPPKILKNRKM